MIGKNYKNGKKTIRSLLSIITLDQTCITLTFPLITLIFFDSQSSLFPQGTSASVRSFYYGLCVSLPYTINMFFAPLLSALSDEFGRRWILFIEVLSAAGYTFCVALGIYYGMLMLIFAGFVIKGAFSRSNPTALAIIGDVIPYERKILYMGYLQFAISVGAAVGPVLGGYLANRFFFATLNFSLPFLVAAVLALINASLIFLFIPETNHRHAEQTKTFKIHYHLRALIQTLMQPNVWRISVLLLLIQLSWSTYYQFLPPILKTLYGLNAHSLGWFIGMLAFWLAVTASVGIKLLNMFFTTRQLLFLAILLVLSGLTFTLINCYTFPNHPQLHWLSAIPVASGDIIAYSCLTALYSNTVAAEHQGKVMGVCFLVTSSVWAFTGFMGGLLMTYSTLLPLLVAPSGVIAALIFYNRVFKQTNDLFREEGLIKVTM